MHYLQGERVAVLVEKPRSISHLRRGTGRAMIRGMDIIIPILACALLVVAYRHRNDPETPEP